MRQYTEEQVQTALKEIENMDHYSMCRMWRFHSIHDESIYFRSDLPTGAAFKERLFHHFGGFTPEISKSLGWER